MLDAGSPEGLLPCGLGARNTLRLEAAMCLYGHEIDDTTTVWEANLGWICKLGKGNFLGRDALVAQKEKGVRRILAGFEMQDRLIARDGYPVLASSDRHALRGRSERHQRLAGSLPEKKYRHGLYPCSIGRPAPKFESLCGRRAPRPKSCHCRFTSGPDSRQISMAGMKY